MSTKKTSPKTSSPESGTASASPKSAAPATKKKSPRGQKSLRWQDPHLERERAKYGQALPSREFLLQLLVEAGEPVEPDDLAFRLDIEPEEAEAFTARLRAMQRDGQLLFNRRGALCLPEKIEVKAGRVEGHKDGFGFFVPDDGSGDMALP